MSQSLRSQVSDSTNKPRPDQDNTPNPLNSSAGQGTHTRQTHSGSISEVNNCSLLDILHQVPTLPETLTADSQKALSATCKSCHIQFIAQVQVVTVGCKEDYAWVLERKWPCLSMVIIQKETAFYLPVLQNVDDCLESQSSNVMLCNILIATKDNKAVVALLRPQHNTATEVPWTRLAAQQLAHQLRIRWPQIYSLTLSVIHHTDRLSLEIVSQLVQCPWTRLTHLCLSGCKLKAEGIFHLIHGNWPCLTLLDVSGNCLNAAGMARLAYADWPWLATVIISFHHTMGADTIADLCLDTGDLMRPAPRTLFIKDMPISADMAAEVADLQLPRLRRLDLAGSGLTAATVSELATADLPMLRVLSICRDDPGALGVLLGYNLENRQNSIFMRGKKCITDAWFHGLWLRLKWIEVSDYDVRLLLTGNTKKT